MYNDQVRSGYVDWKEPDRLSLLDLRYFLADLLDRSRGRVWTVGEMVAALEGMGFAVGTRKSAAAGTSPSKTVSGALRTEIERGRAVRVGWGRYTAGSMPDSTRRRIRASVRLRREHLLNVSPDSRHDSGRLRGNCGDLLGSSPCSPRPSGTSGSQ